MSRTIVEMFKTIGIGNLSTKKIPFYLDLGFFFFDRMSRIV